MAKIFDKEQSSTLKKKQTSAKKQTKEGKGRTEKQAKSSTGSSNGGDLKMDLIKDEIIHYFNWKKNLVVLIIAVSLAIALIAGLYWGLSLWGSHQQNQKIKEAIDVQETKELKQKISSSSDQVNNEIKKFENRAHKANKILKRHIYWTNFFKFLERNTLSSISYSGFSGGLSGQYTLSATADTYESIEAQVKQFSQNKYVTDVRVDKASQKANEEGSKVSFTISLLVDPSIFINYDK